MTIYVAITNAEIDSESPYTTALATKYRDNLLAIQEDDASAPNLVLTSPGAIGSVAPNTGDFTAIGGNTPGTGIFTTIEGTTLELTGNNIEFSTADIDKGIVFDGAVGLNWIDASDQFQWATGAGNIFFIGGAASSVHIDQPGGAAGIPALILEQNDVSEEFVDFQSGAGPITADVNEGAGKIGAVRVGINGTFRWLRFYDNFN
ncbi:hypothetical protein LCGC14_0746810 [marine sediment metagenome]|uniref:Uncharacterized protein n=1 Tax=marine sediment metagenome TaxID=412755 RepID=A0A0F9Q529_9ZZZZ